MPSRRPDRPPVVPAALRGGLRHQLEWGHRGGDAHNGRLQDMPTEADNCFAARCFGVSPPSSKKSGRVVEDRLRRLAELFAEDVPRHTAPVRHSRRWCSDCPEGNRLSGANHRHGESEDGHDQPGGDWQRWWGYEGSLGCFGCAGPTRGRRWIRWRPTRARTSPLSRTQTRRTHRSCCRGSRPRCCTTTAPVGGNHRRSRSHELAPAPGKLFPPHRDRRPGVLGPRADGLRRRSRATRGDTDTRLGRDRLGIRHHVRRPRPGTRFRCRRASTTHTRTASNDGNATNAGTGNRNRGRSSCRDTIVTARRSRVVRTGVRESGHPEARSSS